VAALSRRATKPRSFIGLDQLLLDLVLDVALPVEDATTDAEKLWSSAISPHPPTGYVMHAQHLAKLLFGNYVSIRHLWSP
jgi:hypothetical protein